MTSNLESEKEKEKEKEKKKEFKIGNYLIKKNITTRNIQQSKIRNIFTNKRKGCNKNIRKK